MKSKILNILLASTGGHIGGEETFTRNLALALIGRGHKIWVAPGGPVQAEDLQRNGIPVAQLAISGRSPWGLLKGALAIKNFVRDNNIDIIHCQAAGPAIMGAISKTLHLSSGKKLWLWHDHGVSQRTYSWLPFFLNRLDQSVANSDYELIKLMGNGVKSEKICRIHNGIDLKLWDLPEDQKQENRCEIRKKYQIPDDAPVWGYVGRLSPEKGCDLFLAAYLKIMRQCPGAYFLIVGDGKMSEELKQSFRNSAFPDHVRFCGFQTEMTRYLSALDVLIMPSYMETFSLTVLQAMALRIPVVGTDVGGNPEQIYPEYDGLLCEKGNADGLADAVLRLLREPETRHSMGNTGVNIIRGYLNIDRMIDQIEATYMTLSRG